MRGKYYLDQHPSEAGNSGGRLKLGKKWLKFHGKWAKTRQNFAEAKTNLLNHDPDL